ncbi:secreted protein [Streptomyces davaonensis JCM 4913]|uniref:Secreted protein n=1 Tax=Streptomyces davaonensis (strain DSM 101723 / JCM 4913 / KCC S-0913 / 768) TaxID=1214101 RepID=K4R945_STRDJ|nr:secreted protein [Streptomyces davaonensis]CCK29843.1 secreted protein [Streptomyces davaonensis JCM 4913]
MRRGLIHVLAWSLATGAAVTLSWWGVHTVMAGTAYDPPRALPIAADATTQESKPLASSTHRGTPSGTPTKSPSSEPPSTKKPNPSSTPTRTPAAPSPTASGQVKSYDTDGGRVVFDLRDTYATLVSATPGTGWSMQVWKTESWIRVEFAQGADRVSVFCTWHDSAPRVQIEDY